MSYCIVNCTAKDKKEAVEISKKLLQKKLIACCNIIPSVTSLFEWDGNICEEKEVLMIMKTETHLFEAIETEVKKMHSYTIPELICIPVTGGSRRYLDWVDEQTK